MATEFDFKEQSRSLLKRLGANPGAVLNQGLALAAVEAALREAYGRGKVDAKAPVVSPAAKVAAPVPAVPRAPRECAHEWEEVFLDGRTLGAKCLDCGVLQQDVQARCDHYFVQTGAGEVCVACRKARRQR